MILYGSVVRELVLLVAATTVAPASAAALPDVLLLTVRCSADRALWAPRSAPTLPR